MRTLTRKLLSLLLVFTMVCAMVPAAMAADEGWSQWEGGNIPDCQHTEADTEVTKDATCTTEGVETKTCQTCGATCTRTIEKKEHDFSKYDGDQTGHWKVCSVCGEKDSQTSSHDSNLTWVNNNGTHSQTCPTCKYEVASHAANMVWDGTTGSNGTHKTKCNVTGCTITGTEDCVADIWTIKDQNGHSGTCAKCGGVVSGEHKYSSSGTCTICGYPNAAPISRVKINKSSFTMDINDKAVSLGYTAYDADGNVTSKAGADVDWHSSDPWVADVSSSGVVTPEGVGKAVITLTVNGKTDDITVTVDADADLEVTINEGMGTYYFGDEDLDGETLEDQLYEALDDAGYDDRYDDFDDLTFSISGGTSSVGTIDDDDLEYVDEFGKVEFTVKKAGTFTASFTIYNGKSAILGGGITINVEEGGSAGDIIYPAKSGEDVEFDVNDFEDFWEDKYSKGSLDYVTFGSVSSSRGDLVDADGDKVSSRTKYYADPTSKQADLDGVTFEPGRNTKTTVTIDFTAHGTNNSKRDAELSGTVVILYTEKDPEAIVYSSTGKNITLDADDFLDNYKDTMGSSASNIQIQFLEVPSNGTLYYNYNERTEKGTELTSKNVANYTFSTSSRASRSIEDVTYVPDSRGRSDTVRFACYTSGGDLRYYGEVTFGQTVQNVTVNMTSTSSGVTFQASTFFNADDALLSANTISFGTPSSGTLYKNWNGTSGTRVTASDMFSYVASVTGNASISTVTYVPVAGYSGTVTIPFSAYGAAGGIVSGTVSIRVTATTPTTIFTDVPTTGSQAWAYPYINRLAAAGVVSGVTPTTYGPKQTVKWGEALKMVLLGAGHPAQVEGTGSNWASGYLTYAVNNGIVSNTNINLSSNITRLEMAELAAKALGMSPASRINTGIVGPTDTTNGYVYALYNAGIVGGDSSSGQNRYNGGSTLLRDEMAKIVCGVMDNA